MNLASSSSLSATNYLDLYLSPNFKVDPTFNQNTDCRINWASNSCLVTIVQNPNYVRLTIKSNATWAASNPYMFTYQTYTYFILYKIWPLVASTNKNVYQYYATIYKSDVVNPVMYHSSYFFNCMPYQDTMPGLTLTYINNYYTNVPSNYYTYPGALRLESTDPTQLNNLIIQPNF